MPDFMQRRNEQLHVELSKVKQERSNYLKQVQTLQQMNSRLEQNLKHTQDNYLHVQKVNQELKEFINDLKTELKGCKK